MDSSTSYYSPTPPKKKLVWPFVVLAAVGVLILIIVVALFASILLDGGDDGFYPPAPGEDYVGVLHIEGTISSTQDAGLLYTEGAVYSQGYILSAIEEMKNDANNCGILLYCNTPGGELYATNEVYEELLLYKEETGRPVIAYFAEYACSGGYYLAMAADKIYANPMSTTGSIGVTYGAFLDISGLCEKLGIGVEELTSGANKAMGSYFAPMTNEQKEIISSQLEEYYEVFLNVVLEGRSTLTRDALLPLADGRTFTATQALENGLIDGICRYNEYLDFVARDVFANEDITFYDYSYYVEYDDILSMLGTVLTTENTPASELAAALAFLKPLSGALVYYVP